MRLPGPVLSIDATPLAPISTVGFGGGAGGGGGGGAFSSSAEGAWMDSGILWTTLAREACNPCFSFSVTDLRNVSSSKASVCLVLAGFGAGGGVAATGGPGARGGGG